MLASLRPRSEKRAMQVTPWGPWGDEYSQSSTGVMVNATSATQLMAVYGAAQLIADTIATLPTDVFRNANGAQPVAKPPWLEKPNSYTTFVEFCAQSLWSLLLEGNAYWAYAIDGNFLPSRLTVLDPCTVDVKASETEPGVVEYWVSGQRYLGRLLHIKGISRPGSAKGISPVEAARQSIGLGLSSQEFASRFYSNGASLSGYISTQADLTEPQAAELQSSWARAHSGLVNAHKPGVLDNGATWNAVTVTPEQAQFLQTRNYQAAEIAGQLFLLDPTMLGIAVNSNSLTYANLEQRGVHLVQFTLLRWIVRLEKAFSSLLPKPQYFKFNVAGLERADLKSRYDAYRVALGPNVPFVMVNEVRELEEKPPVPGGDTMPEPPAAAAPTPPAEQPPAQQNINVTIPKDAIRMPAVNVMPPDIHFEPRIEMPAPEVHVNTTPPVVNIPSPNVTVEPRIEVPVPSVTVEAPNVTVEAPEVRVDAPVVNVPAPNIQVDAPIVNVPPSNIRIDAPQIHMPKPGKIRRTFERDDKGITIAVVEEPIEQESDEQN